MVMCHPRIHASRNLTVKYGHAANHPQRSARVWGRSSSSEIMSYQQAEDSLIPRAFG